MLQIIKQWVIVVFLFAVIGVVAVLIVESSRQDTPIISPLTPSPGSDINSGIVTLEGTSNLIPTLPVGTPTPPPTFTPTPLNYHKHIVQAGDSLSSIAFEYNFTIEELLQHNDLPNPNSLEIGQEINIPPR